jgi:hypothetical protein
MEVVMVMAMPMSMAARRAKVLGPDDENCGDQEHSQDYFDDLDQGQAGGTSRRSGRSRAPETKVHSYCRRRQNPKGQGQAKPSKECQADHGGILLSSRRIMMLLFLGRPQYLLHKRCPS